jgi:hypothetical protein
MSGTRPVALLSQRVSGSSAELGELTVDLGEAERLGFLRVLLGWVLDRGIAVVRHAGWVRLVRAEHEGLLRRDLMLPACPEVVLVPDLDPGPAGVAYPDAILVGRAFQGEGRVAVGSSSHLECVQVVTVPAEQELDHLVQVAEGGDDRQPHAAPDRRFPALQRHLELDPLVMLRGPPDAVNPASARASFPADLVTHGAADLHGYRLDGGQNPSRAYLGVRGSAAGRTSTSRKSGRSGSAIPTPRCSPRPPNTPPPHAHPAATVGEFHPADGVCRIAFRQRGE